MEIASPAKINLFLHVTGKRADGYHTLCTLMCCIGLFDTITLGFDSPEISVSCSHPDVPENETNIAFKAADAFFRALKKHAGVHIDIEKNIPVGAGLGGGSSNAAAVFKGLNEHYGRPFSLEQLMAMGLSIGADVPFFIFGRPAIATGIGEKLEACKALRPYHILLIYPGIHVSTAEVYKKLNWGLTKCKKNLKQHILANVTIDAAQCLCNDLESVTFGMHPEVLMLKEALLASGAEGALMSGSGSAVFGFFNDREKARAADRRLMQFGGTRSGWQQHVTKLII